MRPPPDMWRSIRLCLQAATWPYLIVCAMAGSHPGCGDSGGVDRDQPIAFNHQVHTQDLGLDCTTCHQLVDVAEAAGPPTLSVCRDCHASALTDHEEEKKLLQFVQSGAEIPWIRLTYLEDHVYFSHRRHVSVAGIDCATCHGEMAARTTPPNKPLKRIDMDFCMDCHEATGASLDCNACHR